MNAKRDREVVTRHPRYSLISVADETGIENAARALSDFGFKILSTGDTAKALSFAGIPVTEISDYMGSFEIIDGVSSFFYPRISRDVGARKTRRHIDELNDIEAGYVDIVICNLQSKRQISVASIVSIPELANKIDIGGPTLLKAAAKSFERIATVCDPGKYEDLLWYLASNGEVPRDVRFEWAKMAFEHALSYDSMINAMLKDDGLATMVEKGGEPCGF